MMATGARLPKWPRKVAWAASDSGTSTWTTANCTPPNSISCALRPQAGLDEGRAGEGGHIEHAAASRDPLQGPGNRGVGQLGHNPDVWTNLPDPQRGLQRVNLFDLGADHGQGVLYPRLQQRVAHVGAAAEMRDAPVPPRSRANRLSAESSTTRTGVPAEVELLHNAQPHALEPAHNHVIAHLLAQNGRHLSSSSS